MSHPPKKVQINIFVPESWKQQLQKISRMKSVEQNKTISYLDITRQLIKEFLECSGSFYESK